MAFPFLALATLLGAGASIYGQHQANKANKQMNQEQMAFQEYMSSTAHQRQMQDMYAAGLNPALSARFGGASTPGGSQARSENEYAGLPQAVASAIQLKKLKAELENMDATNANLRAQTGQIASNIEVNVASAKRIAAETANLEVSRLKEKATQPLYDAAGNVVKAGVSSAKGVVAAIKEGHNPLENVGKQLGKKIFEFFHPDWR